MIDWALYLSFAATVLWCLVLLAPWQAWRTREALEAEGGDDLETDLSGLTVVIPARNEAGVIAETLSALACQGRALEVILVDDESTDGTPDRARQVGLERLNIVRGKPLPDGWTGKLWAQEQGLALVRTPLTLLLDADIKLAPGMVKSLMEKQRSGGLQLVSLMAELRFGSFWERLLMPAFIYFFKLIYPFALANKPHSKLAAAGGCILVETEVLRGIDGMAAIKDALIDDCTLARKVKASGYKTWIGLTHGVLSQRPYVTLIEICEMVARTAYTQLGYSVILLVLCSAIIFIMYWLPVLDVFIFGGLPTIFVFCRPADHDCLLSPGFAVLSIQSTLGCRSTVRRRALFNDDLDVGVEILARRTFSLERAYLSK